MPTTAKKSKSVKSLGSKKLTAKQAKSVKGGADLLPAVRQVALETKQRGLEFIGSRSVKQ